MIIGSRDLIGKFERLVPEEAMLPLAQGATETACFMQARRMGPSGAYGVRKG